MIRRRIVTALFAVAALSLAALGVSGKATAADIKVATVNIASVADAHPSYKQWTKDVLQKKQEREQQLDKAIKEKYNIPDDPSKAVLTDQQKKDIQDYIASENQSFMEEMQSSREVKMQEVENDILDAVKKIGAAKGYTLVLDSAVVLLGGDDITQDVINEIMKNAIPAPAPAGGTPAPTPAPGGQK